jgi:hypothetical protein
MKAPRLKIISVFTAFLIGATTACLIAAPATGSTWTATATQAQPVPLDSHRFPPVAELASKPELPDPLLMLDGRRVTTPEQWFNERRPELITLFQHYMYGFLPPDTPGNDRQDCA